MTDPGLSWGGGLFMLISWGTIIGLLVFCFSRIASGRHR